MPLAGGLTSGALVMVLFVPGSGSRRRWAARACVVAGGGVWSFGLRDGNFGTITLLAFVLFLGGAVGNGFKALPLGFDDPPGAAGPACLRLRLPAGGVAAVMAVWS